VTQGARGAVLGRVLVIEDDAPLRELIVETLRQDGHEVTQARDGLEGLTLIDATAFDLVVADLNMPNLDGLTLGRALKAHPQTRTIPLILMTARKDAEAVLEGIGLGARYFLPKPFPVEELADKVAKALSLVRRGRAR
jgi:DNA-binding response OmpR family regulator